tara:strand:- start:3506 stop:4633 length:1128 start_codon:yes stop_codon:yes gene_type:complete
MFRPQIQKTRVLFLIAVFNLSLVYISATSKEYIKKDGLNEKLKSTTIMSACYDALLDIYPVSTDDMYDTGLVGIESSDITTIFDTDIKSMKKSKIACTHPNFAAFIVEKFQEIQLEEGDKVAISMTGSLPGANLAVISACQAMNLEPVIISSLGSSAWGANRNDMSWLDIESQLFINEKINYRSVAASIGGENDLGDNLSDRGIEIIEEVIAENDVEFVNKASLKENINRKIEIFKNNNQEFDYKAYVNIGGGAASIGYGDGKDSLKAGIIYPIEKNIIKYDGFSNSIAKYFLDKGIPFVNIKNINLLSKSVGLYPPDKSIEKDQGLLFYSVVDYNLFVIIIAIILSVFSIGGVGVYSHYEIKKRMREYDPDSIV